MLQPLGISAEAEAVYVALGPLPSASIAELARLTSATPEQVAENLEELRKLGLATDSSLGHWRARPCSMWSISSRRNVCRRSSSRVWRPSRWRATYWRPERHRPMTSRFLSGASPSLPPIASC